MRFSDETHALTAIESNLRRTAPNQHLLISLSAGDSRKVFHTGEKLNFQVQTASMTKNGDLVCTTLFSFKPAFSKS